MNNKIKILLIMMIAFFIIATLSPHVFLSNTPTIRPGLGTYIALKLQSAWTNSTSFIAKIFNRQPTYTAAQYQEELTKTKERLAGVPFKQLSKGVYAKDEGNTHSLVEIRLDEMEFIEHTFIVNGKKIVIRVPKDQQVPPQSAVEKLYGN